MLSSSFILAMSLEIRPLAALYPPLHKYFLDWYNWKGSKCRRHEQHTAPGYHWERSPIKHFSVRGEGGGVNAAKGLISREITHFLLKHPVYSVLYVQLQCTYILYRKEGPRFWTMKRQKLWIEKKITF